MEKLSLLERDNTAGLAAGQDENLQKQLADALERITSQTIAINNLESICVKLQDENMFLVSSIQICLLVKIIKILNLLLFTERSKPTVGLSAPPQSSTDRDVER